jgi:hypothetical protein
MKIKHTDYVLELKNRVHWQDLVKSKLDIYEFVNQLESTTGLKFMARQESDTLNGFVTSCGPGYLVSIYGEDKQPDEESPHTFKSVQVTTELESTIGSI